MLSCVVLVSSFSLVRGDPLSENTIIYGQILTLRGLCCVSRFWLLDVMLVSTVFRRCLKVKWMDLWVEAY